MRTVAYKIGLFFHLWRKEFVRVFRDEGVLIFLVVLPLGYPLLYSWIYNNEVVREVPVAVVDLDHSTASRNFIAHYNASPDVEATYYCNNMEEAKNLVANQTVKGILYFPADYQKKLLRGEQGHISVFCDMSLMLTYKVIYQAAQTVSLELNKEIQKPKSFSTTQEDENISTAPLKVEEVPIYNTTGGYGNAILPGVLVLILQQALLLGIGLSAGTANEKKFREYTLIGRGNRGAMAVVVAKALAYFLPFIALGAYVTITVPHFFSFTSWADAPGLLALLVPYLLAVIFFGMTFSIFVTRRENVILLVVFTSVPFLFMTGISWPISNIPPFWEAVASCIPSTFGVRGYLALSSMGGTIADIEPEIKALWMQTAIYAGLAFAVFRAKLNHLGK